jgi:hypothetical protein
MTQKRFDNHYRYFYHDHNGQRRRYGIYSPGLDRFIHIGDLDFWITFETANILSSKINTIVYILPPGYDEITNENCINYSLFNKTSQKLWTSNILVGRQNPALKMLYPDDIILKSGIPVDFENNVSILDDLRAYTNYVYEQSMAIKLSDVFYNHFNHKDFMDNFVDQETSKALYSAKDWTNVNLFQKVKNVLYLSNTAEEADEKIIEIWKTFTDDIGFMIEGYYKILDRPVPKELENYVGLNSYKNLSVWAF